MSRLGYVAKSVIFFGFYFTLAKYGLRIDPVSQFATLVWFPTGLSLAFLLIFGLRYWPVIPLAAFLVNYQQGASIPLAAIFSVGNTLEAVVAAHLLKNVLGFDNAMTKLRDVIWLLVAGALFSTAISASFGVVGLYLDQGISLKDSASTWISWWLGDMVSDLVIAPLILVWASNSPKFAQNKRRTMEFILVCALEVILIFLIFSNPFLLKTPPLTFFLYPPLVWLALRFNQRQVVTMIAFLFFVSVYYTVQGSGPFVVGSVSGSLRYLQSFISVVASMTMVMAAVVLERKILERQKDYFISMASHELKTPITTLKAYTQILQMSHQSPAKKTSSLYLSRMDTQLNYLADVVAELLDITRIQSGKIILKKEKFVIGDYIKEKSKEVQAGTRKHKIVLINKHKKEVYADKERIGQVLLNLLSNAIKYSPRGGEVKVKIANDSKEYVTVSVKDHGIGIDKKYHRQIFHRFFRIEDENSLTYPGLGIGLYLSNEIIRRHGGKMWLQSKLGRGSTFYFKLPLRNGDKKQQHS